MRDGSAAGSPGSSRPAGHDLKLSFSRNPATLVALAREIGNGASVGAPGEAARFGEVVVIAVPWSEMPNVLVQVGSLTGKIVIDTTNQFGSPPLPADGETAARFNAARMPVCRRDWTPVAHRPQDRRGIVLPVLLPVHGARASRRLHRPGYETADAPA